MSKQPMAFVPLEPLRRLLVKLQKDFELTQGAFAAKLSVSRTLYKDILRGRRVGRPLRLSVKKKRDLVDALNRMLSKTRSAITENDEPKYFRRHKWVRPPVLQGDRITPRIPDGVPEPAPIPKQKNATGLSAKSDHAAALHSKARQALTDGNLNSACDLLNRAIAEDPSNYMLHTNLAVALLKSRNVSAALLPAIRGCEEFKKLPQAQRDREIFQGLLVRNTLIAVLNANERYSDAEIEMADSGGDVRKLVDVLLRLHANAANASFKKEDWTLAQSRFQKVRDLANSFELLDVQASACISIANCAFRRGGSALSQSLGVLDEGLGALEIVQNPLGSEPLDILKANFWNAKGLALMKLSDEGLAKKPFKAVDECYENALGCVRVYVTRNSPESKTIYAIVLGNLGDFLLKMRNWPKAIDCFCESLVISMANSDHLGMSLQLNGLARVAVGRLMTASDTDRNRLVRQGFICSLIACRLGTDKPQQEKDEDSAIHKVFREKLTNSERNKAQRDSASVLAESTGISAREWRPFCE